MSDMLIYDYLKGLANCVRLLSFWHMTISIKRYKNVHPSMVFHKLIDAFPVKDSFNGPENILSSYADSQNIDRPGTHSINKNSKYYGVIITHIWIVVHEARLDPASVHNTPCSQIEHDLHPNLANGTCYLHGCKNSRHNINDSHQK